MDPFLSQTGSHPQEYVVADTAFEKSLDRNISLTRTMDLVSAAGLEPATHALKGHCSTN